MKSNKKNFERVSKLLNLFHCKNLAELAKYLNKAGAKAHRQNLCRLRSKGMPRTTEVIIDELLNTIDRLNEKIEVKN